MLLLVPLAWPCTWYLYDDYGDGSADGRQYGGTFVTGGWRPDGGTIVYDLPEPVVSGTITMRVSNVDEAGVSQHDLLEMFSGADGSFSDSRRDNFLQVKFAGDIYEGYDGRVKLQAGPEWYGDVEAGAWTSEYDWNPDGSYDFTISWGGTTAAMDIASTLSTSIDYSYYGELGFTTLRVPNDGTYTRDYLMDDVVIAGVSLCGDPATSESETDTDTDADTDSDTDADTDSDTDADTDSDTDADTDAEPAQTVVTRFEVDPRSVTVGQSWQVRWEAEGSPTTVQFCVTPGAPTVRCTDLPVDVDTTRVATDDLGTGPYTAWLALDGPLGPATSGTVELVVSAPAESSGCTTARAEAAWQLLALVALLPVLRRERG